MIIHNLHVVSITLVPAKADAPLFVDADAVLPGSISGQLFQSITRNCSKIFKLFGRIELSQLTQGDALHVHGQLSCGLAVEKCSRLAVAKAADHYIIITR